MNCKSCGRQSITGAELCPDCDGYSIGSWPRNPDTWLQRRLAEKRRENEGNDER